MTAPSKSAHFTADENKIEIDFKNSDIDNTEMTAPSTPVSLTANNNKVGNQLKDKSVSVCIMTTPIADQIATLTEKIINLQGRISTEADAEMVEIYESAIANHKNEITALHSDLQKEEKKKISAESEAKLISDFQEKDERFKVLVAEEKKRQKHLIDDFVVKKKLFMFSNLKGDYAEWANKESRKILGLGGVGNRIGHNKVDERENTRLRNERLPYGIILQGRVRVDVGVQDKTAKPVYKMVNIQKIGVDKYMDEFDNEYDSLNKAWAFAYREIKQEPKSKSQGSCWALMYCLNPDGTPVMKGKAPHYLKHAKWDLLLDDYDEEYFKDKMGIAVGANPTQTFTQENEVAEAKKVEEQHIKVVLASSASVKKPVKFRYGGKDIEGMVIKITPKTVKVDDKNYMISKISKIEICS